MDKDLVTRYKHRKKLELSLSWDCFARLLFPGSRIKFFILNLESNMYKKGEKQQLKISVDSGVRLYKNVFFLFVCFFPQQWQTMEIGIKNE